MIREVEQADAPLTRTHHVGVMKLTPPRRSLRLAVLDGLLAAAFVGVADAAIPDSASLSVNGGAQVPAGGGGHQPVVPVATRHRLRQQRPVDDPAHRRILMSQRTRTTTAAAWPNLGVGTTSATNGSTRSAIWCGRAVALAISVWAIAGCSSSPNAATATSPATTESEPATSSPPVAAGATSTPLPDSMVVIGHSGATGYNSDPNDPNRDATENSWATGTNPDVDSIYERLLAMNPAIEGHNVNLAQDGSDVDDLVTQAQAAVRLDPKPDLVLVQSVDNDMRCDGRDNEFLPIYGDRLRQVLQIIHDGDPGASVFIISQPGSVDSYTDAVKDNPVAVHNQSTGSPCDVFDTAGNILPSGKAYIESVLQGFFATIASECALFPECRFDQTHDHALQIVAADVTPDSNHYTAAGQRKVAAAVWAAMTSPAETRAAASPPPCPNPDGGRANHCVGDLAPGTYTTTVFQPTLTYTVGEGWANMEDLPGNFLLIPPGGSLEGVNAMTSDFIGVYTSVVPPLPCTEQAASSTITTPQAYVDWLRAQPQLATTEPSKVTFGGLTGLQIDVSLVVDQACSDPAIADAYALAVLGTRSSQLTHGVVPNYPLRLNLLAYDGGVLAIELADAPDGGSQFPHWWSAAYPVLRTFSFGTDPHSGVGPTSSTS